MQQLAEQVVRYDLDDIDVCWLTKVNEEREEMGDTLIDEWIMERIIEELENQACYGIQAIPEGSWLCRPCSLGVKPVCILCPNTNGAMKSTRSGTKWAHVSCSLWIPEVSIGCVERMEPITKISQIPPSRWALVCCLCKERVGACIQCSVKTCKTAFHVTCAFNNNLEMRTILDESDVESGVKLKVCTTGHIPFSSLVALPANLCPSPSLLTCIRFCIIIIIIIFLFFFFFCRLTQLDEEFYTLVSVREVSTKFNIDYDVVDLVYVYWKLKRKANYDRPLLTPKRDEASLLERQQEDSLAARMKMFVTCVIW
ncbi:protein Jade-3 [Octopus bimaculoides]|uniref:protein Jade-3 n=1 Tax=Octopus bimaculoides TaxID=37653 RepID=UPI0022E7DFEA|nr:protein Jade-3 [Octopus bimaculoides]